VRPGLAVYAFGKHPAAADFLDIARLPPVPAPFRHFHDVLRSAVERDGGPIEPTVIAWGEGGESAVLWVQPSRDRGDDVAGHRRRCPLLFGISAATPAVDLLPFAGGRLRRMAGEVAGVGLDEVFSRIERAAVDWPTELTAAGVDVPDGIVRRAASAWRGDGVVLANETRAAWAPREFSRLSAESLGELLRTLAVANDRA
jgi:hypothetical protein